jgi:tetratricopeptide (TPR) repeat protein
MKKITKSLFIFLNLLRKIFTLGALVDEKRLRFSALSVATALRSIALSLAVLLCGCGLFGNRYSTYEFPQPVAVTPSSLQIATYLWNQHFKHNKLTYVSRDADRVVAILTRLLDYSGSQDRWMVHIESSNEADLIITPGNQFFISSELLSIVKSDEALAVILAHGIGHVISDDRENFEHWQQFSQQFASYVKGADKQGQGSSRLVPEMMGVQQLARQTLSKPWSVGAEASADAIGTVLLIRAGFKEAQILQGWREITSSQTRRAPHLLAKHRTTQERASFVTENYEDLFDVARGLRHRPATDVAYYVSKRTARDQVSRPPLRSDTVIAHTLEGQNALALHAYQEAERSFSFAIQEQPGDYLLRHYLAKAHYEAGNYQASNEQFLQALKLNPFHAISYYYSACAHALRSQNAAALSSLKQALLFAPHLRALAREDKDFGQLHGSSEFERLLSNPAPSLIINVPPPLL